jgi:galactoside O-acetyltransferase
MLLLRMLRRWYRRLRMQRRVHAAHGFLLPASACIEDAAHIVLGEGFGISEQCHLYCQDPERGSSLRVGRNVKLNVGVLLDADCGGRIRIGDNVLFGPYVVVRAANHRVDRLDVPIREQGHEAGEIVIEDDVWIGAHVVVLPGVTIGKGAVIGAGSVVSRDIPPYAIAIGSPAQVIRSRSPEAAA